MVVEAVQSRRERKKLTVTQVKEPQRIGDRGIPKLEFQAKDADGRESKYFTFRSNLFEAIQQSLNKVLDAEVETSSHEWEGHTFTDRRVTQVFVDDQPVGIKPGGRGLARTSPEERASIEAQVAVKVISELQMSGTVEVAPALIKLRDEWLKRALKRILTPPEGETVAGSPGPK